LKEGEGMEKGCGSTECSLGIPCSRETISEAGLPRFISLVLPMGFPTPPGVRTGKGRKTPIRSSFSQTFLGDTHLEVKTKPEARLPFHRTSHGENG
jgi:hypothetical protein